MNSASSASLDQAKLEALYVKLEKPIYNVVYRWLWSRDEAHDVTQEAFLRLWKMRDRIDMQTIEPLAYRIAINIAANRRRARKLRAWVGLEEAEEPGACELEETHSAKERDALVRRAIDALPERLRRVIALSELSELSYREVGLVLGIPEGTVGSRRTKAMRLLRERLAPALEGDVHVA